MNDPNGFNPCPSCGASVDSQYCPRCGARVLPSVASPAVSAPVWTGATMGDPGPGVDLPTVPSIPVIPRLDGPAAAVPQMFPTEIVPTSTPVGAQAWSQTPDASDNPQTGLFPGWTGVHPAVATAGAGGVLAPRPQRRRRAFLAVLGIAATTVVVLVVALLIAPRWSSSNADKDGQPVPLSNPAVSSAIPSSITPPTSESIVGSAALPVPVAPPVSTVTVTASVTPTTATSPSSTTAKALPTTKARPTTKATPTTKALPLGVPAKNIVCNPGYVVQLASEYDTAAFKARVAGLKAAGQVPPGSLAADSTKSCKIFTSQSNTLVLYSGPYSGKYDGCAARLAGPADAYIKGSNPANAQDYISCLCPAVATQLPTYSNVGDQGVWIGELQRVLGNKLNINVPDLAGHWGTYTAGTKAAVQKFQTSARLPADGVVDLKTWQALHRAGC